MLKYYFEGIISFILNFYNLYLKRFNHQVINFESLKTRQKLNEPATTN